MSKCSYKYKGKLYSQDRLLRELTNELPSRSQQESIAFLVDYLGMSEEEVVIVTGLIDDKSLGRYKADGKILLSDLADISVAYHEAFHRAWRRYESAPARLQAINEVKKRKGIERIIEAYREVYLKLSENELIEEILADEFADYVANKNFKTETLLKSAFQRFLNFLKKIIGLSPNQVQTIYDKILSKSYKGKKVSAQQYFKDADKLVIQGQEFTVEQKNELISILTQRFVKAMLEINGDIDLFLSKGSTKIKQLLDEYVIPEIGNELLDSNEDAFGSLLDAFYADTDNVLKNNNPIEDSVFLDGMIKNLKLLGLEIKDESEDESDGSLEEHENKTREFQASIEFDPKSAMSKKVKFLLTSLADTSDLTPAFGLPRPLSFSKGFVQIASRMAGIPTSVFMKELEMTNLSYTKELVDLLNKNLVFRNEFISTMAMTENRFVTARYKDGDIYFDDANSGTRVKKIMGEWQNNIIKLVEDWDQWKANLDKLIAGKPTNEDILEQFGIVVNPLLEDIQTNLRSLLQQAKKYKGDKPVKSNVFKELGIKGYVETLAKKQSKFEDAQDLMVYLNGKKIYTLGLNTQQTTVLNSIRYAQSKFTPEMSTEDKINLIREYAPFQVSEFNVTKLTDGSYQIHNKWLEKILNGDNLQLVIPYNADTKTSDIEVSKLNEPDIMSLHVNGALQGVHFSMKHADRSTFFAYTFGINSPIIPLTLSNHKIFKCW